MRLARFLGLCLTAACLSACSYGVIRVDQPEVFTRERILRLRQRDHDFLTEALNNANSYTLEFQGIQDTRTFTGLYNNLRGRYDPLAGQQTDAALARSRAAADRAEELSELDHQIELERRRLLLEQAQAGEVPDATTSSGAEPPARVAPPAGTPAPLGTLPTLPDPKNIQTTGAKLTSQERLDETMAYREAIQSYLLEKQLDDTHDLHGFTLYTLKFDISVLPREGAGLLGRVALGIDTARVPYAAEDAGLGKELDKDYERWLNYLEKRMAREQQALADLLERGKEGADARRSALGWLQSLLRLTAPSPAPAAAAVLQVPPEATKRLVSFAKTFLRPPLPPALSGALAANAAVRELMKAKGAWAKLDQPTRAALAALATRARYQESLADYVDINADDEFAGSIQLTLDPDSAKRTKFTRDLRERLEANGLQPYVYAITPKRHAQNLSRVAAQETVLNLIATLNASFGSAAAENTTQYVKRSQELLSAINRKTLATGFVDGRSNFGWVLGPRFYLRPKTFLGFDTDEVEPAFEHQPAQHSFTVTLALPASLKALPLKGHFEWIDRFGNVLERAPLFRTRDRDLLNATEYDRSEGRTIVRLPGPDLDALTAQLIATSGHDPTEAQVISFTPDVVQEGKPASLMILGLNLWRNPEVYLGGQRANSVEILPDMQGVRAQFDEILLPARLDSKKNAVVDLTVVTSHGRRVRRDQVTILPKEGSAETTPTPKPKLSSPAAIVTSGTLTIQVPASLLPNSRTGELIEVTQETSNVWVTLGDTPIVTELDAKTKQVRAKVDWGPLGDAFPASWGKKAVHEVKARLRVQPKADAAYGDPIDIQGTFIFFATRSDASAALTVDRPATPSLEVECVVPAIGFPHALELVLAPASSFFKAHAGLERQLLSAKARLGVSQRVSTVVPRRWIERDTGKDRITIHVPAKELLRHAPYAGGGELTLIYGNKAGERVSIRHANGGPRLNLATPFLVSSVRNTSYEFHLQRARDLEQWIAPPGLAPLAELIKRAKSGIAVDLTLPGTTSVLTFTAHGSGERDQRVRLELETQPGSRAGLYRAAAAPGTPPKVATAAESQHAFLRVPLRQAVIAHLANPPASGVVQVSSASAGFASGPRTVTVREQEVRQDHWLAQSPGEWLLRLRGRSSLPPTAAAPSVTSTVNAGVLSATFSTYTKLPIGRSQLALEIQRGEDWVPIDLATPTSPLAPLYVETVPSEQVPAQGGVVVVELPRMPAGAAPTKVRLTPLGGGNSHSFPVAVGPAANQLRLRIQLRDDPATAANELEGLLNALPAGGIVFSLEVLDSAGTARSLDYQLGLRE